MTERAIILGIDGGGTKTRLIVADGTGHILTSIAGGPSAISADNIDGPADIIAALVTEGLAAAGITNETPSAACVGVAGAGREGPRRALQRALQARGIADDLTVTTDAALALTDAFGDTAGVVLIAGTGSVAFGRGPTGTQDRCGGWGPLVGDEGGGYWLARRALSAATASVDGREPDTALVGALLTATQCDEPDDLIPWARAATVAEIAALAPVVFRVSENGDQRATTLCSMSAEELVLHIRTLARRLFGDERAAIPVAITGGLMSRGSLMRKMVEHRLKSAVPGAVVHRDEIDGARGAVKLAAKGIGSGV